MNTNSDSIKAVLDLIPTVDPAERWHLEQVLAEARKAQVIREVLNNEIDISELDDDGR